MKRETLRHPKLYDLCARLQCSRPEALGYLTLLWDFTAETATQGNIGKWADGAIARACEWTGEPERFIQALIDARFLDRDTTHRLLVHDWGDHCERWVKAKLEKLGLEVISPSVEPSVERSTEATVEPSPPRDKPNQTKPNQTNPNLGLRLRFLVLKAKRGNPTRWATSRLPNCKTWARSSNAIATWPT